MKITTSRMRRVYAMLIGLILSFAPVCFGADSDTLRTQGLINPGGNLKGGFLLINEMRIYVDNQCQVMDERGAPLAAAQLKPGRWVFMEIEKDPVKMIAKAKKIYLLPRYVKPDEKQRFSFMK